MAGEEGFEPSDAGILARIEHFPSNAKDAAQTENNNTPIARYRLFCNEFNID